MKRALDSVIAALGRYPGETVDLLVGEPYFDPPAEIQRAFERVAGEPAAGYGPPGGLAELRKLLANWLAGESVNPDQVVVTHGAKGGLLALLAALVEPGDEVIHPLPCYPAYPAMVRRLGGVPVGVAEHGDGFVGWTEKVLAATGSRTRAVVLSSPSNPSGSTIVCEELAALVEGCRVRGSRLILDEAYSAFRFDGITVDTGAIDPEHQTLVRVGSASKSLSLCGWRIGWIVADSELAAQVVDAQGSLLNPPATPPQRAMLALPEVPDSYYETNRRAVGERLEAMAAAMRGADFATGIPAGGFYLWVDVRDRLDPESPNTLRWCEHLAETHGVGLWPGEDYGTPGWVRLALPQGAEWKAEIAELERRLTTAD